MFVPITAYLHFLRPEEHVFIFVSACLAILPLGSMEPHGPHAPLGTTAFINYATGVLLAEQWNAIVFPPIAYTAAPRSEEIGRASCRERV